MSLFTGFVISLCIIVLANGSLFDRIQIDNNEDNNIHIQFGNSSDSSFTEVLLSNRKSSKLLTRTLSAVNCSTSKKWCFTYPADETHLTITPWKEECVFLNYSSKADRSYSYSLEASFDIRNVHLYGGPTTRSGYAVDLNLNWPSEHHWFRDSKYMYIESSSHQSHAVLEPYWLFSNGYYIYVDNDSPLVIDFQTHSTKQMTLKAQAENRLPKIALNFVICKLDDALEAQKHAIKHFLGKPSSLPDVRMVTHPIWIANLKLPLFDQVVDQNFIMNFTKEAIQNGYRGRIVIRHKWEKDFGSLEPNTTQFSDFKGLIKYLKSVNFTLAVLVYPYISSELYSRGLNLSEIEKSYFIDSPIDGADCHKLYTLDSDGRYVDSLKPEALNWLRERLVHFRETYEIDSLEFDNGNCDLRLIYDKNSSYLIETMMKENLKMLASLNTNIVTSWARGTQAYGFFLPMNWSPPLSICIANILQLNILGYSFILPDATEVDSSIFERYYGGEAFLRYVQVCVFMPSMQFSIKKPPWQYEEKIANLTKIFVDMHASYSSYIIELMKENVETGAPVNRPIWWISPNDSIALGCQATSDAVHTDGEPENSICKSEFLLGDKILVAPVLQIGQKTRNVYLPEGCWKDGNSEKMYNGPTWIKNYPADLDILPHFLRLQPHALPMPNTSTNPKA